MTYGSPLRLQNRDSNFLYAHLTTSLSSSDIKYGYGSGQQVVTSTNEEEDSSSLWYIKEATGHQQKPLSKLPSF